MLDKANLLGKNLSQGKNDYESWVIFNGLFLAPKTKYCVTSNEFGIVEEHETFNSSNDSKQLLGRSHCFKMIKGKKISAMSC